MDIFLFFIILSFLVTHGEIEHFLQLPEAHTGATDHSFLYHSRSWIVDTHVLLLWSIFHKHVYSSYFRAFIWSRAELQAFCASKYKWFAYLN